MLVRAGVMDQGVMRRMKEVEQAVLELDSSVRGEAFAMMREYILDGNEHRILQKSEGEGRRLDSAGPPPALDEFFERHESENDFENALAAAAFWYGQYGTLAFSTQDIRALADNARVTVPMRIDKTLGQLRRDGKPV